MVPKINRRIEKESSELDSDWVVKTEIVDDRNSVDYS